MDFKSVSGFAAAFRKHWKVPAILFALFLLGFLIRLSPLELVSTYLPDIDTYFFYRLSNYALNNNFHLMALDTLRYYPTGFDSSTEYPLPIYLPALLYKLLSPFSGAAYWTFVRYYSPLMGGLATIAMYFLGKEFGRKRNVGYIAAFLFAVAPSIIMRSPAGYIEKEPATILFIVLAPYFLLRAVRTGSVLSAALSGLSLAIFAIGWGGVQQMYLAIAVFAVLLAAVANPLPANFLKTYFFVFLFGIAVPPLIIPFFDFRMPAVLANIAALLLLSARHFASRLKVVSQENEKYIVPGILSAGLLLLFISSVFSPFAADMLSSADHLLFYHKSVIESTVAENIEAGWGDFTRSFSAEYGKGLLQSGSSTVNSLISILFSISSVWVLAFAGIFVMIYRRFEKKSYEFYLAILLAFLGMYSLNQFLGGGGREFMQELFVLSVAGLLLIVGRKDYGHLLILTLLYSAILGFMSKVRLAFIIGPWLIIAGAYFISYLLEKAISIKYIAAEADRERADLLKSIIYLVLILVLAANFSAGYVIAKGMGPNYSKNWDDAMQFMKNNTPEGTSILSWWDFGYWFQTMSGHPSNLDGGNQMGDRNVPTAQFFTGRMNREQQEYFLQKMGTDYILVDYSMIGKYAAMSKIATGGSQIDSFVQLSEPKQVNRGNSTVLVFQLGPSAFFVPVTQDGRVNGDIVFSTPQGDVYLKYLCTEKGLVQVSAKEPSMDGCLIIKPPYGVFFPVDGTRGVPNKDAGTSIFMRLYLFDGAGIPYVEKVFDDTEVKIFKVNLPKEPLSELQNWWKTHGAEDLTPGNETLVA